MSYSDGSSVKCEWQDEHRCEQANEGVNECMRARKQSCNGWMPEQRKRCCCSLSSAFSAEAKSFSRLTQPAPQPETAFPGGFTASVSRYSQRKEDDS